MLEYVVRPYQSPNAQGRIIIPSTPSRTAERAVLKWGAQSTLPQPNITGVTLPCCQEQSDEKDRQGETVRIFGNDPENYVDVFRANKLSLKKQTKQECTESALGSDSFVNDFADLYPDFRADFQSSIFDQQCDQTWNLNNNTTGVS